MIILTLFAELLRLKLDFAFTMYSTRLRECG